MKKILLAILLLWSIGSYAQITSATLTASGLTCSMCSKSIYKALMNVPFVSTVDANVEKSTFELKFKDGSTVSFDELKKAVQDAGFSVASLKFVMSFSNQEITPDSHINAAGNTFHFLHVSRQKLNGAKTLTLVDKNFLPAKEYKKYAKYTTHKCFVTGMKEADCPANAAKRIYHVVL